MNEHFFDLLVQMRADHIRLDCAALHLARDVYPTLNIHHYLRELDALAAEVARQRPGPHAVARYWATRAVLVEAHGFRGAQWDYHHPQNGYLNRVLDRRRGFPVPLSVVWLEVARRLKWPAAGIAIPGRFLVSFDDPRVVVWADPFADGEVVRIERRRRGDGVPSGRAVWPPPALGRPLNTRAILARMLNDLRAVYLTGHDWRHLSLILMRLAALQPKNGRHLQELAAVHAHLGDRRRAYGYLRLYLEHRPDAANNEPVRSAMRRLQAALAAMN